MSKKILLIDDDVDIVEFNRVLLTKAGYTVCTAYSGSEGLEMALDEKPDLVILDVMMSSVGEGFEVARQIRKNETIRHTPILMLTGVNREHPFNLRIGPDSEWNPVDSFIEKPVQKEVLLQKVSALLQDK
ncbi:MAG TPA: response regulator [bacterium]|nr:response regulator [bacterium]HQG46320.1 response regulator [bacterium]HQI49330.1 response regulator [bacterium]HQJ64694.1 response regulator [bacterium]